MYTKFLSKTSYVHGSLCNRRLWFYTKCRTQIAEDKSINIRLEDGDRVGELARHWHALLLQKRLGDAIAVRPAYFATKDFDVALEETQRALKAGSICLHEAAFIRNGVRVRVDLLHKDMDGWVIEEVKSTTTVADTYYHDTAVQAWVVSETLPIKATHLVHVSTECKGPITNTIECLQSFFKVVDVTTKVKEMEDGVRQQVVQMHNLIAQDEPPPTPPLGSQCTSPYACPFQSKCFPDTTSTPNSVFTLPRVSLEKKAKLWEQGIRSAVDPRLPQLINVTKSVDRYVKACLSDGPLVNRTVLRALLAAAVFPRYFLDFETVGMPIVPWPVPPYQHVPFQVSLHVQDAPNAPLRHRSYLHMSPHRVGTSDPRPEVVRFLCEEIPLSHAGSIIAHHASFEGGVMTRLASDHNVCSASQSVQLLELLAKMWDLEKVFDEAYLDKRFEGSKSIKKIQPVLVPHKSYKTIGGIQDGDAAQIAYRRWVTREESEEWVKTTMQDLERYCALDTEVMVLIMAELERVLEATSK